MRFVFTFIAIIFAITLKAQTPVAGSFQNDIYSNTSTRNNHGYDSSSAHPKWFVSSYAGISTGYSFFNHSGAGYFAAPMGLQLNRRLSNNVYAFAGVSVAPVYTNFNQAFASTGFNKVNSFYQPANLSFYSAATLGLMYINDQKTFSVSGSISVERSNYPLYYNNRFNAPKPNNTTPAYR